MAAGRPLCPAPPGEHADHRTTEFTLRFLGDTWPHLEELQQREIEIKVVHVRTRDFWATLDAQQVDLVCGSFATQAGRAPGSGGGARI